MTSKKEQPKEDYLKTHYNQNVRKNRTEFGKQQEEK